MESGESCVSHREGYCDRGCLQISTNRIGECFTHATRLLLLCSWPWKNKDHMRSHPWVTEQIETNRSFYVTLRHRKFVTFPHWIVAMCFTLSMVALHGWFKYSESFSLIRKFAFYIVSYIIVPPVVTKI